MGRVGQGILAGVVATTALNAVTYLDMAVRGRPASRTPARGVRRLAAGAGFEVRSEFRAEGLGAVLGYLVGVGAGVAYGLATRGRLPAPAGAGVLTGIALLAGTGPMTLLGITDPRRWTVDDWLTDVVPHIAFGVVGAVTYRALDDR